MAGFTDIERTGDTVFAETRVFCADTTRHTVAEVDSTVCSIIAKRVVCIMDTGCCCRIEGVSGTSDPIVAAAWTHDIQTAFGNIATVGGAI